MRELGHDDPKPVLARRDVEMRPLGSEHWFFDVKYPTRSRETRQEMLWTLIDEVPAQV